jgi:predicted metal-dependent phosphoesterase TrpH
MPIIFDQATPVPIRPFLEGHTVRTAAQQGWDRLRNGDLLNAAEEAGFDILLTTDKNMRYRQNLTGRKIAVVVLGRPQWPQLRNHIQRVVDAVNTAAASSRWSFPCKTVCHNVKCRRRARSWLSTGRIDWSWGLERWREL